MESQNFHYRLQSGLLRSLKSFEEDQRRDAARERKSRQRRNLIANEKSVYLQKMDASELGLLHEQSFVREEMEKYQQSLKKITMFHCVECHERWFTEKNRCETCNHKPER